MGRYRYDMSKKYRVDKNVDVVIGTPEEAFWTDIRDKTVKEIEQLEKMLKFNRAILKMAEEKILIESEGGEKNDRTET